MRKRVEQAAGAARMLVCLASAATVLVVSSSGALAQGGGGPGGAIPPLPSVEFPIENPFSEAKRVLGKLLFFEEQLSADSTMACATCHIPGSGGADPRLALHPGPDGVLGNADDLRTSPGVISAGASGSYEPDPIFGLDRQLTSRAANPSIMAMFADELFWDGRAPNRFEDPETGETVIASGGALESQAVVPIVSDIEMAHMDMDWETVTATLEDAVPWALAEDHPADVAAVLAGDPGYPELFEAAFGVGSGDGPITAARIGMAIATYERTLLADQTPWDAFIGGNTDAMTPQQQQGWQTFQGSDCRLCHVPPLFTDDSFRNLGLRPNNEDIGRRAVTGNPADQGRFKTATLRNVGLKPTFMHTGGLTTLEQVLAFYRGPGAAGNPNRDPILPSPIPPQAIPSVVDFIANALTDPRVANETFPFDRPRLRSEMPANPVVSGVGVAGAGGLTPRIIAVSPPNVGNAGFKIGLDRALAGATATVSISSSPPIGGVVLADDSSGPIVVEGIGAGNGYATFHWPIPADPSLNGQTVWMQWRVDDPSASGGVAMSPIAALSLFCGDRCPDGAAACVADLASPEGVLDLADLQAFVVAFTAGDGAADLAEPAGVLDLADVQVFVGSFVSGCP